MALSPSHHAPPRVAPALSPGKGARHHPPSFKHQHVRVSTLYVCVRQANTHEDMSRCPFRSYNSRC